MSNISIGNAESDVTSSWANAEALGCRVKKTLLRKHTVELVKLKPFLKLLIYFNQRLTHTPGQHLVQVQIHVCVIQPCVDLLPPPPGQLGGHAGQKGLVKAASSCCNPKGYSLLTDTCSELTEHFLPRNVFMLHLSDTLYPEVAVVAALNQGSLCHTTSKVHLNCCV